MVSPCLGPAEDGSELRSHACGVAKVEARGHAPGVGRIVIVTVTPRARGAQCRGSVINGCPCHLSCLPIFRCPDRVSPMT